MRYALALVVLTACSPANTVPDGGSDAGGVDAGGEYDGGGIADAGAGIDAGPGGPVLWRTIHYVSETGSDPVVVDLIDAGVKVLSPYQSDFRLHQLTPLADGRFEVADPPAGPIYVRLGRTYVVSKEPEIDLSTHLLGRKDMVISDGGTTLSLSVSGLSPWKSGDSIRFVGGNAGINAVVQPQWASGAASATIRLTLTALLESAKGDAVYCSQMVGRSVALDGGTISSVVVGKSAVFPPLTIVDHADNPVSVALSDVPQASVTIQWPRSSWAGLPPLVGPTAWQSSQYLQVGALPYTAAFGEYLYPPTLATLLAEPPQPQDVAGTLTFGNPFPPSWPLVLTVFQYFGVTLNGRPSWVTVGQSDLLSRLDGVPLIPRLSPPSNLKVNDLDGTSPQTVSGSVRVTWGPPSIGTATGYNLFVMQLLYGDLTQVGTLVTSETNVIVPPELAGPGGTYVFELHAVNFGGIVSSKMPFESAYPVTWGTGFSGPITVQ